MNSRFFFLALAAFIAPLNQAHAEGSSVHGGSAVVCRDAQRQVTSATVTDIYEAAARGIALQEEQTPDEMLIQGAIFNAKRAESGFGHRLEKMIAEIRSMLHFLPQAPIPIVQDIGSTVEPPLGCTFEQLGVFHDGTIIIDTNLYLKLTPLNRAAFLIHEAVYTIERTNRETYFSTLSRSVTARLLSQNVSFPTLRAEISRISISPEDGLYRTFDPRFSDGCELWTTFADKLRAKVEILWRQDPRTLNVECLRPFFRAKLVLEPKSGAYVDFSQGISMKFFHDTLSVSSRVTDFPRVPYVRVQ